jgi:transposase-like protein
MANGRGWRYPEIFRRMAVERFKCCENIEWLAKELGVPRQTLYRWHDELERSQDGEEPPTEKSRESRLEAARAAGLASWHPRPHPGRNVAAEQPVGLRLPADFKIPHSQRFEFEYEKAQLLKILEAGWNARTADAWKPRAKSSIDEYCKSSAPKYEIWSSGKIWMSSPAGYSCFAEDFEKSTFRRRISRRLDPRRSPRRPARKKARFSGSHKPTGRERQSLDGCGTLDPSGHLETAALVLALAM